MKNVPSRATGEAMPSLTRRLFLRGAAIVAPLAAMPALASTAPSYVEENAALLAMEPTLDETEAGMISANAAFKEALRIGTALWPRAPECILYDAGKYDWSIERDILGGGYESGRGLLTARHFKASFAIGNGVASLCWRYRICASASPTSSRRLKPTKPLANTPKRFRG